MLVMTVMNQKGGVGKTTTTLNLAAALQERGWRVLAVDFDPQGSLTTACGLNEPNHLGPGQTVAEAVLTTVHGPVSRHVTLRDVIVTTPAGIDLVPSSQQLATAEAALYTVFGREYALRDALVGARDDYDVILIDSVPTLGLLAVNSLAAADGLIIPVQAEYLAVYGLSQLLQSVALVRERLNPRLAIWGVLLTMVDGRTRHSRDVVTVVRDTLPEQVPVFHTQIPVDVRLKDSVRRGVSVLAYDSSCRAAHAYRELASEVGRLLMSRSATTPSDATADEPRAGLAAPGPSRGSGARVPGSVCLASRLGPTGAGEAALERNGSVGTPWGTGASTPAARTVASAGQAATVALPSTIPEDLSEGAPRPASPSAISSAPISPPSRGHDVLSEIFALGEQSSPTGQVDSGETGPGESAETDGPGRPPAQDNREAEKSRFRRSFQIVRSFSWKI